MMLSSSNFKVSLSICKVWYHMEQLPLKQTLMQDFLQLEYPYLFLVFISFFLLYIFP